MLSAVIGCSSHGPPTHRILVPPALDLKQYGTVGLVTFTVEGARGNLGDFTTRQFEEYMLAAQKGLEVQEFAVGDSTAAVGGARGVPVVFTGHLKVSNVKPHGGVVGLITAHVEALVSADLAVELRSTKTGGVLWRSSANATQRVGELTIANGIPEFSARDPNEAYGHLVNDLVTDVTWDMRSTWVRQ
ncbi:MAG TPA: hypothetical protein VIW28_14690 [Gemmatimonadales bacterium]|jgi:hypothetical protein